MICLGIFAQHISTAKAFIFCINSVIPAHSFEFRIKFTLIWFGWERCASFASKKEKTSKNYAFDSSCRQFNSEFPTLSGISFELNSEWAQTSTERQPNKRLMFVMAILLVWFFSSFINDFTLIFGWQTQKRISKIFINSDRLLSHFSLRLPDQMKMNVHKKKREESGWLTNVEWH